MGKVVQLFDYAGREIPGAPETREIAHTTRDVNLQFVSFIGNRQGLVNPDQIVARESGGREIDIYEEMEDKDAHLLGEMHKRRLAISQIEYAIEPGGPDAEAERRAEEIKAIWSWIPNLEAAIYMLADAVLKGYAVSEIMWDVSEGQAWVCDLIDRRQRRFVFDRDGRPRLRTMENMVDGEELPDRKFLHHVFFSHKRNNPYGRGLGRALYWPAWFKKNDIKFWVIFCEKFGMPTAVGKYPVGATEEQKQTLLDALEAIQSQTGITIPEGMTVELLEGQRSGSINAYETMYRAMNAEISKAILGQTLSAETGPTGGGSLALGQVHAEVRRDILTYDARAMAATLQDLVYWIETYNFGDPGRAYTRIRPKLDEAEDLDKKILRDKQLVDLGVPVGVDYFYDVYGLPRPQAGDQLIERRAPQVQAPGAFGFREFAEKRSKRAEREAAELALLEDKVFKAAPEQFARQLEQIRAAIAAARDFGDIQALAAEPDPDFVDFLSRALATADLMAREHLLERGSGIEEFIETIPDPLPPRLAIEFFRLLRATAAPEDLDEVDRVYDRRAFQVAHVTNQKLIDDLKTRMQDAIAQGQTLERFQSSVDQMFDRAGMTRLAPHHLETVFRTNMQTAYMAGRYEHLRKPGMAEAFPYIQYHTVGDDRVRPEHAAMDGFVARRDDPVWDKWWPPNGYNCRCSVTPISKFEAEELGIRLNDERPSVWVNDRGEKSNTSPLGGFSPHIAAPEFAGNAGKEIFG